MEKETGDGGEGREKEAEEKEDEEQKSDTRENDASAAKANSSDDTKSKGEFTGDFAAASVGLTEILTHVFI